MVIAAHVQVRQLPICSVQRDPMRGYPAGMQPEQRIIANWMERTRQRHGWSWAQWASKAKGVGAATTLTRAVAEEYPSVTSVKTLHALAVAAGEASILDFLSGSASPRDIVEAPPLDPEILSSLLADLAPLWPTGRVTDQSLRALAEALSYGLGLLEADPANRASMREIKMAARAAVDRFGPTTSG